MNSSKYIMESYMLSFYKHFSFKYFAKYALTRMFLGPRGMNGLMTGSIFNRNHHNIIHKDLIIRDMHKNLSHLVISQYRQQYVFHLQVFFSEIHARVGLPINMLSSATVYIHTHIHTYYMIGQSNTKVILVHTFPL